MLKLININAVTLPDAWFQLLYKCIEKGREFIIDKGSFKGQKRLEFDWVTCHIIHPDKGELLPQLAEGSTIPNPVADDYLDDYLPYLMTGEEKEGESYTYGQRICACILEPNFISCYNDDDYKNIINQDIDKIKNNKEILNRQYNDWLLNQMELLIWTYKNKGYRNNQMIMQVGQPTDMILQDPPCLRHIDTRIQDGKLHFMPYFRSWDLFGGFPANLAAIEIMKQYCASQIGVKNGEIIASSKGLHIYDYVWELAETIRGKSINDFQKENKK